MISKKHFFSLNALLILSFLFTGIACNAGKDMTVVKPTEIDSSLTNPGRGFTTTGKTYNEDIKDRRHPQSGVIQKRWYWSKVEPKEGKINYALFDSVIAKAVRNGQQLNFRVMCQNVKMRLPKWVMDKGVKAPYYDDPVFLKEQAKLIKALADRYDGNPGIVFVDIGTVGQWGEWHTTMKGQGIKMPSKKSQEKIIHMYTHSFKKTPVVMLIAGGRNGMLKYAVDQGAGWRADCWGGWGKVGFHSMEQYPKLLSAPNVLDAWKHAPVALESCYVMSKWQEESWSVDTALTKALKWHATEVNNGTQPIPKDWWSKVQQFEKKLGYRFVLKELRYTSSVKAGETMSYAMKWENKGVAPIYHAFLLAFRLRSVKDSTKKWILKTDVDITKWMPGKTSLESQVDVPADVPQGNYEIDLGILNPVRMKPNISLAIEGRLPKGWYKLGAIKIIGS